MSHTDDHDYGEDSSLLEEAEIRTQEREEILDLLYQEAGPGCDPGWVAGLARAIEVIESRNG